MYTDKGFIEYTIAIYLWKALKSKLKIDKKSYKHSISAISIVVEELKTTFHDTMSQLPCWQSIFTPYHQRPTLAHYQNYFSSIKQKVWFLVIFSVHVIYNS